MTIKFTNLNCQVCQMLQFGRNKTYLDNFTQALLVKTQLIKYNLSTSNKIMVVYQVVYLTSSRKALHLYCIMCSCNTLINVTVKNEFVNKRQLHILEPDNAYLKYKCSNKMCSVFKWDMPTFETLHNHFMKSNF